jgi:hypothetical protein
LISFCAWFASKAIPQKNSKNKTLGVDTKKQYFSSIKEEIRNDTMDFSIWENHEEEWYSELREKLGRGTQRKLLQGDEDFKDPSCRALPIRSEESKLRQKHRLWQQMQGVDLESICASIIANDSMDPYAYRDCAKLVLDALGVGRGGEVKFLRWDEFYWDALFLAPEGVWTRMKTLIQQLLYFQCDSIGYLCCFYWILGSYFAVEDGLFRIDETKIRENRAVFPDLRKILNESVAAQLTNKIRAHSDKALRTHNTSRSIRVESNTELAIHPDITPEEQRLAGGFSAGNNSELYARMNPKLGMPAENALAGHKNERKKVYPPSLESLSVNLSAQQLECIMHHLYLVSLEWFLPDGRLHPILRVCTAKLIMEHPVVRGKFGSQNKVVKKLLQATVNAKLANTVSEASCKLDHWAKLIRDDFETMNGLILDATDATVLSVLNQLSHTMNAQTIVIKRLERQTEILTNQVASQQVVIESQSGSLASAIVSSLKSAFSVGRNGPPTQTDIIGTQHYATSAAGVETSVSPLTRTTASHAALDGALASHVPAPAPNEAVEVSLHESNPPATNAAKRMSF